MDLKVLQIETTSLCNSHCIFCIHNSLKTFGTMSDNLFLKILNDAREIPTIQTIIPMMLGEPFLDKKIISRLKLINQILPKVKISLFTNCSLLTDKIVKELWEIKNLKMYFSLNGTKEVRKRLMDLDDFEHCFEMIKLYASKKECIVQMVQYPSVSNGELKEFKNLFPNAPPTLQVISYKNWSGDKFCALPKTSCKRAMYDMTIMWNGLVNLCCMEYGKVIFGDANKSSIKEIWESPSRQAYCLVHSEGKFLKNTPCYNCTLA
ncbi:MAG TPA: radical SAM/SPASM domain-containing protein [Candidatus Lokiarchaeia archaeon]